MTLGCYLKVQGCQLSVNVVSERRSHKRLIYRKSKNASRRRIIRRMPLLLSPNEIEIAVGPRKGDSQSGRADRQSRIGPIVVHLNKTTHNATIIVKMAVPICVAEHDIGSAVRTAIIGGVEETAEIRLNP
jgi:hypothetical protein